MLWFFLRTFLWIVWHELLSRHQKYLTRVRIIVMVMCCVEIVSLSDSYLILRRSYVLGWYRDSHARHTSAKGMLFIIHSRGYFSTGHKRNIYINKTSPRFITSSTIFFRWCGVRRVLILPRMRRCLCCSLRCTIYLLVIGMITPMCGVCAR